MRSIGIFVSSLVVVSALVASTPAAAQQPAAQPASSSGGGGVRIALQGRLDALNVAGLEGGYTIGGGGGVTIPLSFVPQITAGVRLVDTRLFLGLGFGFFGASESECAGSMGGCADMETIVSTSGFGLAPLVSFDLLRDASRLGALYLLGWLNLASFGGQTVETIRPGATDKRTTDNDFWWGLNVGAGVRGNITPSLAIGTEWGWGFATTSNDGGTAGPADDTSLFIHGVFGTIFLEASIGL